MTEILNIDNCKTNEFNTQTLESQNELEKIQISWKKTSCPNNVQEFQDSISNILKTPLVINIEEWPLMPIDSIILKKFASQSLEQLDIKILSAKLIAAKKITDVYFEIEKMITGFYTTKAIEEVITNYKKI